MYRMYIYIYITSLASALTASVTREAKRGTSIEERAI